MVFSFFKLFQAALLRGFNILTTKQLCASFSVGKEHLSAFNDRKMVICHAKVMKKVAIAKPE